MSDQESMLHAGDVMTECELTLRADGTCEHGGYWLDPVRMHLVLGLDVSPWHERAIIQACQADEPGPDGIQPVTSKARRGLWVWSMLTQQPSPAMGITLWLRPGQITLPEVAWFVAYPAELLCHDCAIDMAMAARDTGLRITQYGGDKGIDTTIILVGRDHKVLAISRPACHSFISLSWAVQLADAAARRTDPAWPGCPPVESAMVSHPAGHPECMDPQELEQFLVAEGWREPAADRRLRHKRQRGNRRAQP
jgi:hypothetical protein